jgi:large subunit ribosomal protein L18
MASTSTTHNNFLRRRNRTRARLAGNQSIPRLSVHRTLRHIYVQIIDDAAGTTLASTHDGATDVKGTKTDIAKAVGAKIAELAKAKKIEAVRFDRGGYKFHGRIAALAEAARTNGLKF